MATAVAVAAASVLGFLAGLVVFKAKRAWCPVCGTTMTCPDSTHHASPV